MESTQDSSVWDWVRYFEELSSFITSIDSGRITHANEAFTEYVLDKMNMSITTLGNIATCLRSTGDNPDFQGVELTTLQHIEADVLQLKGCLFEIGSEWQAHLDDVVRQSSSTYHYRVQSSSSGQTAGRPRFDISRQQLEYLSSMNFSWTQIADLLGVSRMTIYRRRHEFGLLSDPYTTIDDGQLRSTIRDLRTQFPEIGESIMWVILELWDSMCKERESDGKKK